MFFFFFSYRFFRKIKTRRQSIFFGWNSLIFSSLPHACSKRGSKNLDFEDNGCSNFISHVSRCSPTSQSRMKSQQCFWMFFDLAIFFAARCRIKKENTCTSKYYTALMFEKIDVVRACRKGRVQQAASFSAGSSDSSARQRLHPHGQCPGHGVLQWPVRSRPVVLGQRAALIGSRDCDTRMW